MLIVVNIMVGVLTSPQAQNKSKILSPSAVRKTHKFLIALFYIKKTYFLAKSYWRHLLIFLENTALLSFKKKEYLCF